MMPMQRLLFNVQDFRKNILRTYSSWRDFEYKLISSQEESNEDKLKMMVHVDEILMDEIALLDIIIPHVKESDVDAALPIFYAIMRRRAHEVKASDDPEQPELIWYSRDSDSQLVIALGDMAVNIFDKVTKDQNLWLLCLETEQLHILRILNKLLDAMPWTQPAAAVYLRLCALADPARLSDDVRKKLAELMVAYYNLSRDEIKDIRPVLLAISSCQDLDADMFSFGIAGILERSAKLPQADIEQIHDELRGALAAVAKYFGRPDAAALADCLSQNVSDWYFFWRLCCACVELAKVDNSVFTPAIVGALERVSFLYPGGDIWRKRDIQNSMKVLREVTGLPTHPEVVPAADSQSSSAADS